jgi:hypothetical protein
MDEAQMVRSQQQTAAAQQQAAAAPPAPPPAAAGNPLPLGTVVAALPAGCTSTPVGGVELLLLLRRALLSRSVSGDTLVYVTAQPK